MKTDRELIRLFTDESLLDQQDDDNLAQPTLPHI